MRIVECKQYSPDWWQARRGVPTASEFGNIITPKTGEPSKAMAGYACQLVADLYDSDYGMFEDYVSAAMIRGTRLEPEARRFYEFEREMDVAQVGFCLTDDGRFGCSPDALVGDDGGLESKSPAPKTHIGYLLDGGLPAEYRPQVHGCLTVTGREWWDFLSYCPGLPPLLVRVEPDEYTERLRAALDEFWTLYQGIRTKIDAMRVPMIPGREVPDPMFMA